VHQSWGFCAENDIGAAHVDRLAAHALRSVSETIPLCDRCHTPVYRWSYQSVSLDNREMSFECFVHFYFLEYQFQ
jgi:hypothetical protein